jgi:hypothetical protein
MDTRNVYEIHRREGITKTTCLDPYFNGPQRQRSNPLPIINDPILSGRSASSSPPTRSYKATERPWRNVLPVPEFKPVQERPAQSEVPAKSKKPRRKPKTKNKPDATSSAVAYAVGPHAVSVSRPQRFPLWVRAAGHELSTDIRYDQFVTTAESIYSSLLPYQVRSVREFFGEALPARPGLHIIDATAHIGCDTSNFAWMYPGAAITAIEVDPVVAEALKQNMARLHNILSKRVSPPVCVVNTDCLAYLGALTSPADLVYFDPPWGSGWKKDSASFTLELGGRPLGEIAGETLAHDVLLVVVKAPENVIVDDLVAAVRRGCPSATYVARDILKPKNGLAYRLIAFHR